MAIKVIVAGRDPKDDLFKGECNRCKCIAQFARSDAKLHSDPRDEGHYIECPTCGGPLYGVQLKGGD